jgi:hypothetical protein
MKLTPFVQVDDVAFSTTADELVARKGRPRATGRNGVGLDELDYGDVVFRFQASSGRLEEVTRRAHVVHIAEVAVPFGALAGFVGTHDPDAFERAGFVVSPRYGIAFVPDPTHWVTALARHCIRTWEAL